MRTVQRCPQCGWTGTLGKRSSPKGLVLYYPPRVTSSKTGTNAPRPWKGSGGLWGGGNRRPHDTGSILDTGNILLLDLSAGYIGCSVCADSSICTFGCIFIYVYCILINIIKKEPNKYKTSRIRIYQCILDGCGFGIKYHLIPNESSENSPLAWDYNFVFPDAFFQYIYGLLLFRLLFKLHDHLDFSL